jgi:hypothetical protein
MVFLHLDQCSQRVLGYKEYYIQAYWLRESNTRQEYAAVWGEAEQVMPRSMMQNEQKSNKIGEHIVNARTS